MTIKTARSNPVVSNVSLTTVLGNAGDRIVKKFNYVPLFATTSLKLPAVSPTNGQCELQKSQPALLGRVFTRA